MRALVVDDNPLNSKLVAVFLRRLGGEVSAVDSGDRALASLREAAYDMVLLDLRMPQLTGERVCRRIRDELRLTDLHVVAYTAHGMPEERQRMRAAGFDGLLIKPITFSDVRAVCNEYAAARGVQGQP